MPWRLSFSVARPCTIPFSSVSSHTIPCREAIEVFRSIEFVIMVASPFISVVSNVAQPIPLLFAFVPLVPPMALILPPLRTTLPSSFVLELPLAYCPPHPIPIPPAILLLLSPPVAVTVPPLMVIVPPGEYGAPPIPAPLRPPVALIIPLFIVMSPHGSVPPPCPPIPAPPTPPVTFSVLSLAAPSIINFAFSGT